MPQEKEIYQQVHQKHRLKLFKQRAKQKIQGRKVGLLLLAFIILIMRNS